MTPLQPADDPKHQARRGNPQMDSCGLFRSVISECLDVGLFQPRRRDSEMIAQAFWDELHGVASLQIASGGDRSIDWRPARDRAVFMLELIMQGLLAEAVESPASRT